ncbi:restriction endonuclease subunit S [Novipirellula rosea]|uniref:Restriction endonuclease subunit S n=1 Tax=Novipirellula rosea TaxID=1031540 RepID=A0ABP8M871_9BACT
MLADYGLRTWEEKAIGDLGRVVTGKTPPKAESQYWDGDELFVSPKDLEDGELYITTTESRITERALDKFSNQVLPANSVMFTSLSFGFGKMGITSRPSLTNQQINSIIVNEKHDYRFVYYLLRSYTPFIFAFNSGIDTPIVPKSVFEKVKVLCPPLKTQRKIAGILSAYDDLIENNRRRIAILERMAEEVYREWFVRMRFPGCQDTQFVKGVPEGWRDTRLSAIADVNPESLGSTTKHETIRYVDIGSVTTDVINGFEEVSIGDAPGRAKRVVRHGDIIWSSVRPGNRAHAIVLEPPDNLIVSTGFAVLRHKPAIPVAFLYQTVTTDSFVGYLELVAKGAAYPATAFDDFERAPVLLPTENLLERYDNIVKPMLAQRLHLDNANRRLKACRELVIGRLISGRLPLDDLDVHLPESMSSLEECLETLPQELAHA